MKQPGWFPDGHVAPFDSKKSSSSHCDALNIDG